VGTSYVLDIDNIDETLTILGFADVNKLIVEPDTPFPFGITKGATVSFKLYAKNVFMITSCSLMVNLKMTELKLSNYNSVISPSPITRGVANSNDIDPVLMGKIVTRNGLPIILESGKFIKTEEFDMKVEIDKQQTKILNAILKNFGDKNETISVKRPYDSKKRILATAQRRTVCGHIYDDRVTDDIRYPGQFDEKLIIGAEISVEISVRLDRSNKHKYGAMLYFELVKVIIYKYPQVV